LHEKCPYHDKNGVHTSLTNSGSHQLHHGAITKVDYPWSAPCI
jgi:hypothetical protein